MDQGDLEPQTFYANVVTSQINVDELVLELRRVFQPHREFLSAPASGARAVPVPLVTPTKIAESEPVARVVMTFSAAVALWNYLDEVMPRAVAARQAGQPLK